MNDFLMHYGIPGMKWGVRRFQMKGSSKRTEAGKKRYANKKPTDKKASKDSIEKIESLKSGPERAKVVNKFLKNFSETERDRYEKAMAAYNEAKRTKNVDPRQAFFKSKDDYDKTKSGKQHGREWQWLYNQITQKSGDWYNGKGVSKGFKSYLKRKEELHNKSYEREQELRKHRRYNGLFGPSLIRKDKVIKEISDAQERLDDELVGTVLKDLDFPDSPENRKRIRGIVFYD